MNFSWWQILLIVGIGLLLFGATRLPKLAKSLGQSYKEFKNSVKEAREEETQDSVTDPTAADKAKLEPDVSAKHRVLMERIENDEELSDEQKQSMLNELRKSS